MASKTVRDRFHELQAEGYSDEAIIRSMKAKGLSSADYDTPYDEAVASKSTGIIPPFIADQAKALKAAAEAESRTRKVEAAKATPLPGESSSATSDAEAKGGAPRSEWAPLSKLGGMVQGMANKVDYLQGGEEFKKALKPGERDPRELNQSGRPDWARTGGSWLKEGAVQLAPGLVRDLAQDEEQAKQDIAKKSAGERLLDSAQNLVTSIPAAASMVAQDVLMPTSIPPGTKSATEYVGKRGAQVGEQLTSGLTTGLGRYAHHPVEAFQQDPVGTALDLLPVAGAGSKALEAAARAAKLETAANAIHAARYLPEKSAELAGKALELTADATQKGVGKAAERVGKTTRQERLIDWGKQVRDAVDSGDSLLDRAKRMFLDSTFHRDPAIRAMYESVTNDPERAAGAVKRRAETISKSEMKPLDRGGSVEDIVDAVPPLEDIKAGGMVADALHMDAPEQAKKFELDKKMIQDNVRDQDAYRAGAKLGASFAPPLPPKPVKPVAQSAPGRARLKSVEPGDFQPATPEMHPETKRVREELKQAKTALQDADEELGKAQKLEPPADPEALRKAEQAIQEQIDLVDPQDGIERLKAEAQHWVEIYKQHRTTDKSGNPNPNAKPTVAKNAQDEVKRIQAQIKKLESAQKKSTEHPHVAATKKLALMDKLDDVRRNPPNPQASPRLAAALQAHEDASINHAGAELRAREHERKLAAGEHPWQKPAMLKVPPRKNVAKRENKAASSPFADENIAKIDATLKSTPEFRDIAKQVDGLVDLMVEPLAQLNHPDVAQYRVRARAELLKAIGSTTADRALLRHPEVLARLAKELGVDPAKMEKFVGEFTKARVTSPDQPFPMFQKPELSYSTELSQTNTGRALGSDSGLAGAEYRSAVFRKTAEELADSVSTEHRKILLDSEARRYNELQRAGDPDYHQVQVLPKDQFPTATADQLRRDAQAITDPVKQASMLKEADRVARFKRLDSGHWVDPVLHRVLEIEQFAKEALQNPTMTGKAVGKMKANLTARSVKSAFNNLGSNTLLQMLRTGDPTGGWGKALPEYKRYRGFAKQAGEAATPELTRKYQALERSGVLDTTLLDKEIGKLDSWKVNQVQEDFHKFGDNFFKLGEASRVWDTTDKKLKALKPGEYLSIPTSETAASRVTKTGESTFSVERETTSGKQRIELDITNPRDLARLDDMVAKAGKLSADSIFFDYSRVPALAKIMRYQPLLGLASPFYSYAIKSLDLPGKPGLGTRILQGVDFAETNSAKVLAQQAAEQALRGASRSAMSNLARTELRNASNEDLARLTRYLPDDVRLQLAKATTNPAYIEVTHMGNWNFLGMTLTAMKAALRASTLAGNPEVPTEDMDPKVARMLVRAQTGQLGSAADFFSLIGMAGSPILDAFNYAADAKEQGKVVDADAIVQKFFTALAGGTAALGTNLGVGAAQHYGVLPLPEPGESSPTNLLASTSNYTKSLNRDVNVEESFLRWAVRQTTGMGWKTLPADKLMSKKKYSAWDKMQEEFLASTHANDLQREGKRLYSAAEQSGDAQAKVQAERMILRGAMMEATIKSEIGKMRSETGETLEKLGGK